MTDSGLTDSTAASWASIYNAPSQVADMLRWANTHAPMLERILDARSALEIGTGTATLSGFLSKWVPTTVSVDVESGVLSNAAETTAALRTGVVLVQGDGFRLPFSTGAFDVAFSQGLLEHFDDASIRRLIDEQRRVARRVVVSVPGRWYPHVGGRGPGLIGNERLLSLRQWRSVVAVDGARFSAYRDPKAFSIAGRALGPAIHVLIDIPGEQKELG